MGFPARFVRKIFVFTVFVFAVLMPLISSCGDFAAEKRRLTKQAASRGLLPGNLIQPVRTEVMEGFGSEGMKLEIIPAGKNEMGLFVRFTADDSERGCFTWYRGVEGPYPWLPVAARNAAFADPRYAPIRPDEENLIVEVSVVGEFVPMDSPDDFIPGFHTVLLRRNGRQAVIQATLARERGLNREDFLNLIGHKAGMGPGTWNNPGTELMKAPTIYAEAPLYRKNVKK